MSADTLNPTTYNNVAANTVNGAVLDASIILAWRSEVKDVVDQHAVQINAIQSALWNAVINGNFGINQRVKSGTVTLSAGEYGHDRWKAGASGCTYTFSTSNGVTTITITSGSLIQTVEGLNLFSGTYTLSWEGTAQGKIGAGSYGSSGISGSITGGTNTNIEFGTGTLRKVQFNIGDVALPFQSRSFAEELALCQRYYEKSYEYSVAPGTVSGQGQVGFGAVAGQAQQCFIPFKVRKRSTPTVLTYDPVESGAGGSGTSGKYRVAVYGAKSDGNINNVGHGGFSFLTPSTDPQTRIFHYTADAEL